MQICFIIIICGSPLSLPFLRSSFRYLPCWSFLRAGTFFTVVAPSGLAYTPSVLGELSRLLIIMSVWARVPPWACTPVWPCLVSLTRSSRSRTGAGWCLGVLIIGSPFSLSHLSHSINMRWTEFSPLFQRRSIHVWSLSINVLSVGKQCVFFSPIPVAPLHNVFSRGCFYSSIGIKVAKVSKQGT